MKNTLVYLNLIFFFLITSCVSKKSIVYLQGNQNSTTSSNNYEPIIQQDDNLYIHISSSVNEAVTPFNLESKSTTANGSSSFDALKQSYLVDNAGNIDFPVLGTLPVAGLTLQKLKNTIKEKLLIYVKDPVVNIRILNFKVSVLGEVNKPGIISVNSQRITLLEAISQSGDLTLFGKRDNILLIRDFQGTKTYNRIDITKADFVNSPFYYLDQNDVIYVEPKKSKIDATAIGPNVTTLITIASFIITTALILKK